MDERDQQWIARVWDNAERLAMHWCESDGIETPHVQPNYQNEFDRTVDEFCLRF